MFGEPRVDLTQPFLANKILSGRGELFSANMVFAFKSVLVREKTGADKVLDFHVSLLIREVSIKIKL